MSPWIALILTALPGFISGEVKTLAQVPMQSREACKSFAENFANNSGSQNGVICISTESGEMFAVKGQKK